MSGRFDRCWCYYRFRGPVGWLDEMQLRLWDFSSTSRFAFGEGQAVRRGSQVVHNSAYGSSLAGIPLPGGKDRKSSVTVVRGVVKPFGWDRSVRTLRIGERVSHKSLRGVISPA
jgi:hypothetical protein